MPDGEGPPQGGAQKRPREVVVIDSDDEIDDRVRSSHRNPAAGAPAAGDGLDGAEDAVTVARPPVRQRFPFDDHESHLNSSEPILGGAEDGAESDQPPLRRVRRVRPPTFRASHRRTMGAEVPLFGPFGNISIFSAGRRSSIALPMSLFEISASDPTAPCHLCQGSGQILSSRGDADMPCLCVLRARLPMHRQPPMPPPEEQRAAAAAAIAEAAATKPKADADDSPAAVSNRKCAACLEPATHVFDPCGHYCSCGECHEQFGGKCPICRKKFKKAIKVF